MAKTLTLKKTTQQVKKPAAPVVKTGKVHRISKASQIPLTLPLKDMTTETTTQPQQSTTTQVQETTPVTTPVVDIQAQMLELAQSQVPFKVLAPFVSCLVAPNEIQAAIDANYKELYVWSNGSFFKQLQLTGGRHIRMKVDHLPSKFKTLEDSLRSMHVEVTEELNFLPAGKIPGKYWEQIVTFFRQVMKLKKADMEAHAWILWSEDKGYFISVPKQVVSKASVAFSYDADALPAGSVIVVDVHSHNTMGAFYSGTDNNNDKNSIYYSGVVGKITDDNYEWVMRFNMHDVKKSVNLEDIFEMAEPVEIPQEWLDQVEVEKYGRAGNSKGPWGAYIGNGKNTGGESGNVSGTSAGSTQNPAKWTSGFPMTQQQLLQPRQEGGSDDSDSKSPFRTYTDSLGDDGEFMGFGYEYEGDTRGNVNRGGETDRTQRSLGSSEEMKSLLRDIPGSGSIDDIERLDRQATAWMQKHGYDVDGNDMLTLAANDIKEMKGTVIPDSETLDLSQEDNQDPVGSGNDPVKDAYEVIDTMIVDLENNDEMLMDIATQCYHLMTDEGRRKIQTNGLN